jgi:saccharopine dehydrogenase-like NADP-dependent oxidoreductase
LRAREVQQSWEIIAFPLEQLDASKKENIIALAKKHGVDLIMNACDPSLNVPIFDAAYEYGCTYMDMAMTLSEPHPTEPFTKCGIKLGDYQFERAKPWEEKGLLALVGLGVEPGMADVFARYAQDYLFDEIEEIGIRDGANIEVRGYQFAPNFSIWTRLKSA